MMDIADFINDRFGFVMNIWEQYGWWIVIVGLCGIVFIVHQNIV